MIRLIVLSSAAVVEEVHASDVLQHPNTLASAISPRPAASIDLSQGTSWMIPLVKTLPATKGAADRVDSCCGEDGEEMTAESDALAKNDGLLLLLRRQSRSRSDVAMFSLLLIPLRWQCC
jgi:hypothetical protein